MANSPTPRVLVVGLSDVPQNQFTRALDKFGVPYERASGDPGRVPIGYDAAIIIKSAVSHEKFWQVKETYKGKRLFVATQGFTEIRTAFEDFLFTFATARVIEAPPPMAKLLKGTPYAEPEPEVVDVELIKEPEPNKPVRYDQADAERIVRECMNADMTAKETAEMLNAHGLVTQRLTEYKETNVYQMRAKFQPPTETRLEAKPKEVIKMLPKAPETKAVVPEPPQLQTAHELIAAVITSSMTAEQKLEVIAKINNGEVKTLEATTVEVLKDMANRPQLRLTHALITEPQNAVSINLSQKQAVLVVRLYSKVREFSEGKLL